MKTYFVDAGMLGTDATPEQAKRMVDLLRERGFQAEYGFDLNTAFDHVGDLDSAWDECLSIIAQESVETLQ